MELALEVLLAPFVACLVLTGIHTYLGLHVVSRGVIFVDLALAQIAALGATFAFLLGYEPTGTQGYLYSLLFTVLGAAIFSISRLKDQRIPQEAIIGISFAVASATVILMADRAPQGAEHVEAMLTGALLWVPGPTILKTAAIYGLIGLFHWIFRHRFLTISLDPAMAQARGWSVRWWDFLFYTSFGFVITSSVAMAGVLLVFSFLVVPSVIAMMFARRIGARLAIGWTVGTLVSTIGLSLSYTHDFPSGPAVVCTFGLALVLSAVGRYVTVAENRSWAVAKVAAAVSVVVVGIWVAFNTAAIPHDETGAGEEALLEPSGDPADVANRALAALEQATESPPEDAVASLLSADIEIHQLMVSGKVKISESAVKALARVDAANEDGRWEKRELFHLLEEIAFHAEDPWARLRGAEALVERRNELGVGALIEILEHDAPVLVHLEAAQALKRISGHDIQYDPEADDETRLRSIRQWREWWVEHRAGLWSEPDAE